MVESNQDRTGLWGAWRGLWGRWRVGRELERLDRWPPPDPDRFEKDAPGDKTIYRINWSIQWHTLAYRQAIRWYNGLKGIQITAAAVIPILTATVGNAQWSKALVASLRTVRPASTNTSHG
jgi:hypothetical protein